MFIWAKLLLAAQLGLGAGLLRAAPPPKMPPNESLKLYKLLRPGKYRMTVAGVICNACTRTIYEHVRAVPDVKEARFDYEDGYLWVTIGKDRKVRLTKIARALRMAARKLDLGVDFQLTDVQYVP